VSNLLTELQNTHGFVPWCVSSETFAKSYWNSQCTWSAGIPCRKWCHLSARRRKL